MSKVCNSCGQENINNATVCSLCGEDLSGAVIPQVGQGAASGYQQTTRHAHPQVSYAQPLNTYVPAFNSQAQSTKSSKKWTVTLLLSIFMGAIGVDRFYLGYTKRSIIKIAVFLAPTLLTWIVAALMLVMWSLAGLLAMLAAVLSWGGGIAVFVLWFLDLISIATRKLKPNNGSNYID